VWSASDDLIVFGGPARGRLQPLLAVRPDGTEVKLPGIQVRVEGERFRFLPDGSGLVYVTGETRRLNFALLDLATMKTRPLTDFKDPSVMRT
jgi:hypothetical protein